ncbi:acyl carrier protein [Streptomyces sp. AK04-3B]|uniref:acyl carrier protein n=1 Tax=unclassified Streptomyces TaxID=2593676 RepID=UPI0029AFDD90|nr:acyl carrier protein [Streptomyces sp. AK04-3B]MDX3803492.1 acyl carrier protein [Streptomyces sp. AK04-3B]
MTLSAPPKAAAPLYRWLTDRLAVYMDRAPESIDPTVPLAAYGMDSVCALSLCGDVEDELGIAVEPTLAWDHPTVAALAGHLTARGVRLPDGGPQR